MAVLAAVAALALLAGCNDGGKQGGSAAATSTVDAPPAQVGLSLADGSTDVSPVIPLEISVTGGTLAEVTVVDGGGAPVGGHVGNRSTGSSGAQVWTPDEPLSYATTYTLTATATNAAHEVATAATTFTTVKPKQRETVSIGPLDGQTVGVAMPIRVYFDHSVAEVNRAEVEKHLTVVTPTPTDGSWNWFSGTEVHFRPSTYWPANTDVTVHADLYGVDLGNGRWGAKNRTISFHIGARHVSIADAAAHTLQVYDGDRLVQTFPMSAGKNSSPTHNGIHVTTEMNRRMVMDSSTFGLAVDAPGGYRANVEYAVRISNNGEFVHAAPWSVADQGHRNVSHGCINLSTANAAWFFDFSQPGDAVEVRNSVGPTLSAADGDIHDWAIPWETWQAGSALK